MYGKLNIIDECMLLKCYWPPEKNMFYNIFNSPANSEWWECGHSVYCPKKNCYHFQKDRTLLKLACLHLSKYYLVQALATPHEQPPLPHILNKYDSSYCSISFTHEKWVYTCDESGSQRWFWPYLFKKRSFWRKGKNTFGHSGSEMSCVVFRPRRFLRCLVWPPASFTFARKILKPLRVKWLT